MKHGNSYWVAGDNMVFIKRETDGGYRFYHWEKDVTRVVSKDFIQPHRPEKWHCNECNEVKSEYEFAYSPSTAYNKCAKCLLLKKNIDNEVVEGEDNLKSFLEGLMEINSNL